MERGISPIRAGTDVSDRLASLELDLSPRESKPLRLLNTGRSSVTVMAQKVPGWLERDLLPQLSELKGEIRTLGGGFDGEFKAVHSELRRLDEKIDGLDKRMGVVQRLAMVEGKISELESRR